MRTLWSIPLAALLSIAIGSNAAEVVYQHPNLTIVAKDETLDSVLNSVGKAMQIVVKTPTGFNPVVSCDIHNLPIKRAFDTLLRDMSYSLAWKDDGERLVGLTILAGTADSVADTAPAGRAAQAPVDDPGVDAEREVREAEMERQRQDDVIAHEARMTEEAMQNEADMAEYFQSQGIPYSDN